MESKATVDGMIVLAAGLLASGVSSFLERFAILGVATDIARGVFDGLAVVTFAVAIFVLVRIRRSVRA